MVDRQTHAGSGDSGFASLQQDRGNFVADETLSEEATESRNGRISAWFDRWRKPIRSWFSRRAAVPRGEVDDLAQEVFLRLLRYSDDVAVENPQGYLFRIAANVANEWRDRSRVRQPHDRSWLDELEIDPSDQPDNTVFQSRVNRLVQNAVDRLPPRQREVLLLHVNEGLTYKQIAERLNLTYRVVLRDLTRAYGSLRIQLKADDL